MKREHLQDSPLPEAQQTYGLVLSGEFFRSLTEEQLRSIGHLASELGIEVAPIHQEEQLASIKRGLHEAERPPVALTKGGFRQFAAEHGFGDKLACHAWNAVGYTARSHDEANPTDPYTPVKLIAKTGTRADEAWVELATIRDRLIDSTLSPSAWIRGTTEQVRFLVRLTNELLQPDEPLPATRQQAVRTGLRPTPYFMSHR
ncbi:MAG TPA: hypothetical protein VF557_07760 [Jatrophihabitans sp.]|jgi:hypothetical protein|uniref:hypothetical protein n=1 Tax=Jatrophihabitans sp. TaxID=1932789 RepID=UPI002F05F4DE